MMCDCDFILPSNKEWEPHYGNCSSVWSKVHGESAKNEDGSIKLRNKHLSDLDCDHLYHLGLDNKNYDLKAMFGDVKFVCMGGTQQRMKNFAEYMTKILQLPSDGLINITENAHRYAMYKVGPVLSASHGIGIPSMSILLEEVIKMLSYAGAKDPIIFRIGTSGGLNIPAGSVVISSWAISGTLEKSYNFPIMGKIRKLPSYFDKRLAQELKSVADEEKSFKTVLAGTMAADNFYEGQARLDGPFCDYTESDKLSFLHKLSDLGVNNIEMEASALAALTSYAGLRAVDVCVTFLDRLEGDQVTSSKATLTAFQERPMIIIGNYISQYCKTQMKK